jgi:hypothetical protein
MITKEQLIHDVVVSSHNIKVLRPHKLGFYTQVDTSEGFRDNICPHLERVVAELRLGVNFNVDPGASRRTKEEQQKEMASTLHRHMYGDISSRLYSIFDDVRMLSYDEEDNPALGKLKLLLSDLS